MSFNVLNLMQWVEENKDYLKPPVNNKEIYPGGDFIVMIVGGPNERKDYHYNETAEFFLQLKGDIVLKVIENGKPKDITIAEGEIYLLQPRVLHSPQRPADTIGLVIEQKRNTENNDGFVWFCENCGNRLYEEYFKLQNVATQFPEIFDRFYSTATHCTCQNCGQVMEKPIRK